MFCNQLLRGNIRDCAPNLGGLKNLYIGLLDYAYDYDQNTLLVVSKELKERYVGLIQGDDSDVTPIVNTMFDAFSVEYYMSLNEDACEIAAGLQANKKPLFKFDLGKTGAEVTATPTVSLENGTSMVENRLTFQLDVLNITRRATLALLQNNDLWAIAEDNKGNFILLGVPVTYEDGVKYTTTPLRLVDGSATTGASFGDANRATVVLSSISNIIPPSATGLGSYVDALSTQIPY